SCWDFILGVSAIVAHRRLDDLVTPIRFQVFSRADRARGPAHDEPGDLVGRPQADQKAGVMGGHEATSPLALAVKGLLAHRNLDSSADRIAVASRADQVQANPTAGGRGVVPQ